MTEWKSTNPTSSSSQSSIAAMKNFLADGRLTPLSSPSPPPHPLAHPATTPIPQAQPGVGNGGGRRVCQGNTSPANITTVVEMQSKPLPLSPVCPICLPFILFSILSFIILRVNITIRPDSIINAPHGQYMKGTVPQDFSVVFSWCYKPFGCLIIMTKYVLTLSGVIATSPQRCHHVTTTPHSQPSHHNFYLATTYCIEQNMNHHHLLYDEI